jgi:hypothetical protein
VDWRGNSFNADGTIADQEQVWMTSFQINGSLKVTEPPDVLGHTITVDLLPGGPSNFLEITDSMGAPPTTQRVYVGMGDYLGGIEIDDMNPSFDSVYVEKVFFHDNVNINFFSKGGEVQVSPFAHNLDNIAGNVNIFSGFGENSDLLILDSNDPFAGDAWTITRTTITRFGAGNINYDGMDFVGIIGGDQGATYDIQSTETATTTGLTTGAGSDTINIQSTSGPLNIDNNGGVDTVTVGSLAPKTGGDVSGIQGKLTVSSSAGTGHLILDDSADATARSVTVSPTAITGLAPAEIDCSAGQESISILGGTGGDTFTITSPAVAVAINGGSGANTLIGPNATNTWTLTGPGGGTLDHTGFTAMEVLEGGPGADTFRFMPGGTVPLLVDGGGGVNTLDYSADGGVAATVSLQARAASRIRGGAAGGFSNIQRLIGSSSTADNLVGANITNLWNITGVNAGTVNAFVFSGVENLFGGFANDTFKFGASGNLTGKVAGGAGTNRLDYSGNGGTAITVNLQTSAAPRLKGGTPGGFANINSVVGSTSTGNKLIGPNTINIWQITGASAGQVGPVVFQAIGNLVGGTGIDTFRFSLAGRATSIRGGGNLGDWLDYSLFPTTIPVHVNLAAGSATDVGAGAAGAVLGVQNVRGGAGNDTLTGNALGNILIGGSSTNVITGGSGRSILVGGAGKSSITGGQADDILIAGTTTFDANEAALMAILKEWQRTDKTYAQRIADLRNGGGFNGTNKLVWGATVHDNDPAAATLTGGPGLDWFFADLGPNGILDHITDRNNGGPEQVD